ncbi:GAF domain-containing protein [Amycolatopsis nigrescens]|uniref:sensor histidine kinase n=1 Tax=Amycolatopsis nigrescens TaxID=381445 RepID=UPI0003779E06|nr:GAF domain-containing protein [Amycolatopsis nigrescens]
MSEPGIRGLLNAVAGVTANLSLPDVLHRIVSSSCELVGARYGALGVLGHDRKLTEFVQVGISHADQARIGRTPAGLGILGLLADDPRPLRLSNLRAHPARHGFPPGHPPMRSFLGVPIRVRDKVFGNLYLAEKKDGEEFTARDEEVAVALAAAAGVSIENATLFEEGRRRERWLAASHQVTNSLLAGADPAAALRLIAEQARVAAGASAAGIARPRDGDRSTLVFDVVESADGEQDRLIGLSVPAEGTATGMAFTTGEPVVVRQYGDHAVTQQAGIQLPALVRDLDSAIAVPLTVGDEKLGVLLVAKFGDKVPFTEAEVQLVRTFGGHAAVAIEFARAEQDRERLAVFEDRDRIARDLHDLVIQRLFAIGLGLEGIGRLSVRPEISARLSGFAHDLDRTIRDIRTSIFSLQEPAEAQGGLRSELLRLTLDTAGALGFEPRIGFDGPLDTAVPTPVRAELAATLREALSNVARHAAANTVSVEVAVDRHGRWLTLTVTDDGVGIPDRPARRSGLANLAERAARWGGTCSARRADGHGTRLTWTAKLRPADSEDR